MSGNPGEQDQAAAFARLERCLAQLSILMEVSRLAGSSPALGEVWAT
jgi:hypothetical protein